MRVVYATFSTWVTPTVAITRGEPWDEDDPVVQSHKDWFTDDPTEFARSSHPRQSPPQTGGPPPVVEQATAAPGEKRASRRISA